MKTTIWQEQRKLIKAKKYSSSIVLTADPRKTVAEGSNRNTGSVLSTQPTYTCTGPVCQLLIPPLPNNKVKTAVINALP